MAGVRTFNFLPYMKTNISVPAMSGSHNIPNFVKDILSCSELNIPIAIQAIQGAITMEQITSDVNKILKNDMEYLNAEYKITQAKKLLCVLRMCDILRGLGAS